MAQARPCAFPRAQRIRKRADFVRIQAGGRRAATRHLLVLVAACRTGTSTGSPAHAAARPPTPRLGLVASRKVGGAIARNRAKRLVREAFRRFPELFPEHVDVVVILRAGAGSLCLDDVLSELRSIVSVLRRRAREALTDAALGGDAPTPSAPCGAEQRGARAHAGET